MWSIQEQTVGTVVYGQGLFEVLIPLPSLLAGDVFGVELLLLLGSVRLFCVN